MKKNVSVTWNHVAVFMLQLFLIHKMRLLNSHISVFSWLYSFSVIFPSFTYITLFTNLKKFVRFWNDFLCQLNWEKNFLFFLIFNLCESRWPYEMDENARLIVSGCKRVYVCRRATDWVESVSPSAQRVEEFFFPPVFSVYVRN